MKTKEAEVEHTAEETALQSISVKDFMIQQGFVSVASKVRKNTNSYPYITFINKDNVADNIYFSKNAALRVAEDDKIAKGFFEPFIIVLTENVEGEKRFKIATGDNRVELNDLF